MQGSRTAYGLARHLFFQAFQLREDEEKLADSTGHAYVQYRIGWQHKWASHLEP
jgi:hypothetical protein